MHRMNVSGRLDGQQDVLRELATDEVSLVMPGSSQSRAMEALEAMQRIREGTYDRCAVCNRRISEARRQAKPEATRCVRCQEKWERR